MRAWQGPFHACTHIYSALDTPLQEVCPLIDHMNAISLALHSYEPGALGP